MDKKEKEYFKEVKHIEKEIRSLLKGIDFNYPKPKNLKSEKKKFLQAIADDKFYNPSFKYEKRNFEEEKILKIKKFKVSTKNDLYGFKKLYKEEIKGAYHKILCYQNWGNFKSTKYAIKVYGKPSYYTLKKAIKYCREYKPETVKFKTLTPKIAGDRLKEYTMKLTGNNIKVKYQSLANKVNIAPSNNLIMINPEERFTSRDVKRLKVHEIGTHYMRYYNGQKFGIRILKTGTKEYIETEEGLAVYMEELRGVASKAQMYIYAGRVIATYYAPTKSFYEVFEILKKLAFRDETAFAITFRAKRNICDTSEKGGYTKDFVYFSGYEKVKKYCKKNDIKNLFIGKIKIKDIKKIRKFIKKNKDDISTVFDLEPL